VRRSVAAQRLRSCLVVGALLLTAVCGSAATAAGAAEFDATVQALGRGDFDDRARAAAALAAMDDARTTTVLEALRAGALRLHRADDRVVIAERDGRSYRITDAASGAALGEAGRRDLRRIGVNNALRAELAQLLAAARLKRPDPQARLEAVRELMSRPSDLPVDALRERLAQEPEAAVRQALRTALALAALDADDPARALAAVEVLRERIEPGVRTALRRLAKDPQTDATLRAAAADGLAAMERRLARYETVQTLFFGLSLGSVLVLAAIGLAITFGVMGVINMAHGELIMLGAYTTWLLQQWLPDAVGIALLLAVPAAFLVAGATGIVIERGVIRHLYGRPLETLLATFGISLILQQTVRSLFSPLNRSVAAPDWLSGSWELVPGLALTSNRIGILLFSLTVFALLWLVLHRTPLGLAIRAVAQNRPMARALGIRSDRIDALTFGLGAGVAGLAGVALSQLTNVGPNLGQAYIIDAFLVVVFGGVGNLWGTLVAGLSLGVASKWLEPVTGAVLAKILLLVAIILFIQRRPNGLFPPRGRVR